VDGKRRTALVVDDDPDIRKLVSAHLTRLGFAVSSAADGRSAIKRLDEARPDLVCIDLMLPESSGLDVCEYVMKTPALKDLPLLMISARTTPADRAVAEELGARAYLTKPFTRAQFEAHVKLVLGTEAERLP
jgi:DNA-binding response OmpR family regulator